MSMKIVAGVDGTETATRAALRAAGHAERYDAELHLLCAFDKLQVDRYQAGSEQFEFSTDQEALDTAETVVAEVHEAYPDVAIAAVAYEGKPAEAMVGYATEIGADVIVVGNKRVQGLGRLLGSVAADVCAHAPCDVYVAHTHPR